VVVDLLCSTEGHKEERVGRGMGDTGTCMEACRSWRAASPHTYLCGVPLTVHEAGLLCGRMEASVVVCMRVLLCVLLVHRSDVVCMVLKLHMLRLPDVEVPAAGSMAARAQHEVAAHLMMHGLP
jgi:hypothetical protein